MSLIASIASDNARWATETVPIPSPDAIVVSGDIIQGVMLGESDYRQKIAQQYEVAAEFLSKLAERFLSGDRSRIILVPGNHDICWNTAFQAMREVPTHSIPKNIPAILKDSTSPYRWSWHELKLYEIVDWDLYAQKLAPFFKFRKDFYKDITMPFSIDDTSEYQLFELDDRRILVSTFNSVKSNDCFSEVASLDINTIGSCSLSLIDNCREYKLKIGVWHHSLYGDPHETGYLSVKYIHEMNNNGFQLGLHGHQHFSSVNAYRICLSETSKAMAITSVGSLCAGTKDLPRGVNRQYSVIVINDDYLSAEIHVREMDEGGQFRMKNTPFFPNGYATVSWSKNDPLLIDPDKRNFYSFIEKIEHLLRKKLFDEAIEIIGQEHYLLSRFRDVPYLRALISECYSAVKNHNGLIDFIETPRDQAEGTYYIEALMALHRFEEAGVLIQDETIASAAIKDRVMAKITMHTALGRN